MRRLLGRLCLRRLRLWRRGGTLRCVLSVGLLGVFLSVCRRRGVFVRLGSRPFMVA